MSSSEKQVIGESVEGLQVDQDTAAITGDPGFVSEIIVAEYRTLRDEILKKMDHRTSLVVCSVTVSSVVLGIGIERQSGPLLLVSPLVSLLLGILIMFHNMQIGEASAHLRDRIENQISTRYFGYVGWHENKDGPKYTRRYRILAYRLPLFLIAVAPAVVAAPLALTTVNSLALLIPILIVDATLLIIYVVQIIKT